MWQELIILGVGALVVSLVLNRVMIRLAPVFGLMDRPGERRVHREPVARAGGLAVWLAFLIVAAVGIGVFHEGRADDGNLSWKWYLAFALSSSLLVAVGVVDDRRGLGAWIKLAGHVLAASLFFLLWPVRTGLFPGNWPIFADYALFVAWAVLLINAFNLIDGLDGLCGGLGLLSCCALAAFALVEGRADSGVLLLVMACCVAGFLRYNISPARIFLGDAGSMLIGFFLATVATEAVGRKAVLGMVLLPIAVAGVPLLDVLLALWRRGIRRVVDDLRKSPVSKGLFDADADHLHHRMLEVIGSQRKAAGLLHLLAVLFTVLAFLPMLLGDRLIGITVVGFLVVVLSGLRSLARVELEQTGNMVVHMAVRMPGRRRLLAMTMFIYDLLALSGAGIAALAIETNLLTRREDATDLFKFVILFVVLGSVALLASKVHRRLWLRATMRDIFVIQLWMAGAALGTFSLFSLMEASMEWSALRMTLLSFLFSAVAVSLPRASLDLLREFGLAARHGSIKGEREPVVVVGAGNLGTLFLDHLKSSIHDLYPRLRIVGYIDEAEPLHGRRVRSFPVLGGIGSLPRLVREKGLRGVIVAVRDPERDMVEQLKACAAEHGLRLYRWNVGLEDFE